MQKKFLSSRVYNYPSWKFKHGETSGLRKLWLMAQSVSRGQCGGLFLHASWHLWPPALGSTTDLHCRKHRHTSLPKEAPSGCCAGEWLPVSWKHGCWHVPSSSSDSFTWAKMSCVPTAQGQPRHLIIYPTKYHFRLQLQQ